MSANTVGWRRTTLGKIAHIVGGATPNTKTPSYWHGSIPWCTPTDVTRAPGKYLEATTRNITVEGLENCGAKLLPPGAVLLCSRATIGEMRITKFVVCTNQGLLSLVGRNGVSNGFLYYHLLAHTQEMRQKSSGSTFVEIGRRDLASIKINVPARDEQRAIVSILSDVDEAIILVEELIEKKIATRKAVMSLLLTGVNRLPELEHEEAVHTDKSDGPFLTDRAVGSRRTTLGDVARVRKGELITSSTIVPGPFPVVAAGLHPTSYHNKANRCDPTISVSASGANAGHVTYWAEPIFASDCSTISLKTSSLSLRFLYYYMKSIQQDILALKHGGAQPHVYPRDLAALKISVPARDEQHAVVSILSDVDEAIVCLERLIKKIRAIKQGMMQDLLTGRIRLVELESLPMGDAP